MASSQVPETYATRIPNDRGGFEYYDHGGELLASTGNPPEDVSEHRIPSPDVAVADAPPPPHTVVAELAVATLTAPSADTPPSDAAPTV